MMLSLHWWRPQVPDFHYREFSEEFEEKWLRILLHLSCKYSRMLEYMKLSRCLRVSRDQFFVFGGMFGVVIANFGVLMIGVGAVQ